jgi:hypothetical protein
MSLLASRYAQPHSLPTTATINEADFLHLKTAALKKSRSPSDDLVHVTVLLDSDIPPIDRPIGSMRSLSAPNTLLVHQRLFITSSDMLPPMRRQFEEDLHTAPIAPLFDHSGNLRKCAILSLL